MRKFRRRRPRLLVAEDNPSNFKLVEVLLRRDYELVHAMGRPAGRRYIRRSTPRSGIDGYQHAVMDGYDAAAYPRACSTFRYHAAYAFETDRQRMFQAGFNECLAKPLRADELRSRIASLLSR